MKKVSGYINVRALGTYNFEFYVNNDTTDKEIERLVNDACDYYINYDIEEGYELVTEVKYKKKEDDFNDK